MGAKTENHAPLESEDLAVGYHVKGQPDRLVAKDLNLQLVPGEFVCLLGPNGVGKSTLIRTLAGMQDPLRGCIQISGSKVSDMNAKERARSVSVVLTDSLPHGMFDGYSVVALGRHPHTSWTGGLGAEDKRKINWALEAVGATPLARRQISELSDGERQKIMIARALAQETNIMLLDEPTAFLDLPRRVELMRTLRDLARKERLCILLSTHDLDLALRSADRLWLLTGEGRLTTGMPEELALQGEIARTFASDEVDWDAEQGAFRMHPETCSMVSLEGTGHALVWTRRALTRIGYEVVENGQIPELRIRIEGESRWMVSYKETRLSFDSLGSLVEGLLNFRPAKAGKTL
ncbi:ABC transporter ATP-binding protein [Pelagicoccus albus]|uniref:ABC transporter ATP-binding protein n=1 Tax=Pelagicoccus albus TaxID=415222 RepID=A0A7X1E9D3_9BACT|nr:ABC transporter ATP-binding protein [Pelagicoccus albus]MBC2607730.1 ABC transporter ATP-binding protein [Pelagicoccus albus]